MENVKEPVVLRLKYSQQARPENPAIDQMFVGSKVDIGD